MHCMPESQWKCWKDGSASKAADYWLLHPNDTMTYLTGNVTDSTDMNM